MGFLVQEGDVEGLVKSAGINTLLWGGIYNPIIPISSKNERFANQLLKIFNVEVLYKVSETNEVNAFYDKHPFLKAPNHFDGDIFNEDRFSKKNSIGYLDSLNIVNLYWEKEFRDKPKGYKSNCLFLDWDDLDKYSNLFSISFGYFTEAYNLKEDYQNAFEKGLKAKRNLLSTTTNLPDDLHQSITPITATSLELNGYGGSFKEDGIYIGKEDCFTDLINFWNLRASGKNIEFLSQNDLPKFKDFIQQYLNKLDKAPNLHPNITEYIYVYSQDNYKKATSLIKNFHIKSKSFCFANCSKESWNGLNIKPRKFYFDTEDSIANVEKIYDSYNLSLALPQKKFLSGINYPSQSLVVEINPLSDFEHPNHTFKLPFIRELNEFYSRESCVDPSKLRISKEGIGLIIKTGDNQLSARPIKHENVIDKLFELAGYKAEINQAGLLAKQIIRNMREEHSLEACRVFKIRGVRNLLRQLKTKEKILWSNATKIIWNEGQFKKHQKLYIETRDKPKLSTQSTLNYLIKKNILSPKLNFRYRFFSKTDFKCRNCGLKNRILWKEYEGRYICPYCKQEDSMPQYIMEDVQGVVNKYFNFSKSGLFTKDNNQEGAIPVILTLLTLKRIVNNGSLFYAPSMNLKGCGINCEIDFTVINTKYNKTEVGIGECKSKGSKNGERADIDRTTVENLKHIQESINKLGIDCYIIFSKTNEAFKNTELDLFKQLDNENRKFILLTNQELEEYEPYWHLEETNNLPKKYALCLEDMYLNSRFIYLENHTT